MAFVVCKELRAGKIDFNCLLFFFHSCVNIILPCFVKINNRDVFSPHLCIFSFFRP